MVKQTRVTERNLIVKLKHHNSIPILIRLNGGLISRHTLVLNDTNTHIIDYSHIDDTKSKSTIENYFRSFYGDAIRKRAVFYDD